MKLQHLTSINDLSDDQIQAIFKRARKFSNGQHSISSSDHSSPFIANLFFEPSTRTRLSFEAAAKRLGMQVLTLEDKNSSREKGESYLDTLLTLEAMGARGFIIRTTDESASSDLVQALGNKYPHVHIINAGGGKKDHPTQGLLDVFTMQQHYADLEKRKICIIGDIKHSRVARSTVQVLNSLNITNIHLIAPQNLLPESNEFSQCHLSDQLADGLSEADVVITLRIQKERMQSSDIPNNDEYQQRFGLHSENIKMAKPNAIIMHPGPMNRGVEISSGIADSSQSVITQQVANGVFIRMAILDLMLN